ncbi:hypothetical protein Taro_056496 [Colocasia esculenta]|uniref:Uncharacterized protein n=1 Tax=Colocasia esculenta TaxID=4460 RepID=A0A843XWN1_COLES|nr:hypothetical protein [Colocasia esculenta]
MYCKYHAMLLHPTDMCPIVRSWIKSLIQEGNVNSEGNLMVQPEAREEAQQQPPRRKKGSRRHQVSPPHEQTSRDRNMGQCFENPPPDEEPSPAHNQKHQQDEAGWTTVASRMRLPLAFPKRGGSHGGLGRENTSRTTEQAKKLSPLEMAQAKKQKKNRQKNLKRRLKKQAEQAAAMTAPLEPTPLQKL